MSEQSKRPGGAAAKKKKNKGRGSGQRRFVTSAEDLEHRNTIEAERQATRKARRKEEGADSSDSDELDSEDEFEAMADTSSAFDKLKESVEEEQVEKKVFKPKGVSGLISTRNPNAKPKATKNIKAKDMDASFEQKLSRREREALEKERAQKYYMAKHLAGETDQAKKDMERLALVKKRRDEGNKRKEEAAEAEKERESSKKSTKKAVETEALDARTIKGMKPAVIKDKLKERGLSTQGQKKDLINRLIDFENEKSL